MADSGRWSWGAAACPGARDAGREPANVFAVSVGAVRFRGAGSFGGAGTRYVQRCAPQKSLFVGSGRVLSVKC